MIIEKNPHEQGLGALPMLQNLATPSSAVEPTSDGGAMVTFGDEAEETLLVPTLDHYENLALTLDEADLQKVASDVVEGFEADLLSRTDWENVLIKGLDLLGLRLDDKSQPFQGACAATHPLVIENIVKFQAKAIQEIFPANGPVRTQIVGAQNDALVAAADRVQDYMNFQLTEEMPEYFDETERLLFYLAFAGLAIRKIYYSPFDARPCAEFVKATDFVISNYATDIRTADRYTHRMYKSKIDIMRQQEDGVYREIDLGSPSPLKLSDYEVKLNKKLGVNQNDDRTPGYTILEQHCFLEGPSFSIDGQPAPYIVTVEYTTKKVLSIRRNWKQGDLKRYKRIWFTRYSFVPSDGFYSFGFVHLIGSLAKTATLIMRSLADAGQFANLQGGFKLKGIKMPGANDPIAPGEFRDIEVPNMQKLSDAIVPFTYKEPSRSLFELLGFVVQSGQKFADTTETVVNDAQSYGPVGTILALLDQSAKFFSSIHKRLHKSLRDEFKILKEINRDTIPARYPYDVAGAPREVYSTDFSGNVKIIPVSDPNISTQAHRTALAQAVIAMAQQAPQIHNIREAYKRVYTNMGIQDIDQILPPPPSAQPADPVTDLMSAVQGTPIKAFPGQDHASHVAVKMAWIQDPLNGGSVAMGRVMPVIQANVQEHMILQYQEQMGGLVQAAAPPNPQVMNQVMAQAAQKIMEANKASLVADPDKALAEAAQAEVLIAAGKLVQTKQKDAVTAALRNRELDIRESENMVEAIKSGLQIKTAKDEGEADRTAALTDTVVKSIVTLAKPTKNGALPSRVR